MSRTYAEFARDPEVTHGHSLLNSRIQFLTAVDKFSDQQLSQSEIVDDISITHPAQSQPKNQRFLYQPSYKWPVLGPCAMNVRDFWPAGAPGKIRNVIFK